MKSLLLCTLIFISIGIIHGDFQAPIPFKSDPSETGENDKSDPEVIAVLFKTVQLKPTPDSSGNSVILESQDAEQEKQRKGRSAEGLTAQEIKDANLSDVELEKLKLAAINAGLSDSKADRVVRATQALNVPYSDVMEIQKKLNHPSTTTEHAEKIRRALENAVVDTSAAPVATKPENVADLINLARQIDPKVLQKLIAMAKLSGLDDQGAQRLARAISSAPHLNSTHVQKLETAIQENAPSADDLNKLAAQLESSKETPTTATTSENSWDDGELSESLEGGDWIIKSDADAVTQREGRAIGVGFVDSTLFPDVELYTAKRYCGVMPNFDDRQRGSPGQYPWSAAILSVDNRLVCAATLVSESIVVTTASCIVRYKRSNQPLKVVLGSDHFDSRSRLREFTTYVSSAVLHPAYSSSGNIDIQHDIGLLRLRDNVDFHFYPHIFPICVSDDSFRMSNPWTQCNILGWPDSNSRKNAWKSSQCSICDDVQLTRRGCNMNNADSCITGRACTANEGSAVSCASQSGINFLWGIVAQEPRCHRDATVTLPVVNIMDNYLFIKDYLWSPNPNQINQQLQGNTLRV